MIFKRINNILLCSLFLSCLFLYKGETRHDYIKEFNDEIFTIYSLYYIHNKSEFEIKVYSKEDITKEEEFNVKLEDKRGLQAAKARILRSSNIRINKQDYFVNTINIRPNKWDIEILTGEVIASFSNYLYSFTLKLGYFYMTGTEETKTITLKEQDIIYGYKANKEIIDYKYEFNLNNNLTIKAIKTADNKVKVNLASISKETTEKGLPIPETYTPYITPKEEVQKLALYDKYTAEICYSILAPIAYMSYKLEVINEEGYLDFYQTETFTTITLGLQEELRPFFQYGILHEKE